MNRRYARVIATIAASGALAFTLSACATTGMPSACSPSVESGGASETITASSSLGSAPVVEFPTPLYSNGVQASVLIEGDGTPVQEGEWVTAEITLLDGTNGEVIETTAYDDAQPFAALFEALPLAIPDGLECQPTGSRIALTIPATVAFGDAEVPAPLTEDDTLVAVVDIVSSVTARASGTILPSTAGVPSVVRAPNGQPGITIPGGDAPSDYREATLIQGDGATVATGDSVLVQYTGVTWAGGEVFDSTWDSGAPTTLVADEASVIPGFAKALTGKEVGSQVIAVIPPDEAYGDQAQSAIPANSTLVFVIDILAIQ